MRIAIAKELKRWIKDDEAERMDTGAPLLIRAIKRGDEGTRRLVDSHRATANANPERYGFGYGIRHP
jgi:hypothetical protein